MNMLSTQPIKYEFILMIYLEGFKSHPNEKVENDYTDDSFKLRIDDWENKNNELIIYQSII